MIEVANTVDWDKRVTFQIEDSNKNIDQESGQVNMLLHTPIRYSACY